MEKKIIIAYWSRKYENLPWTDRSEYEYSKEFRNQIIDECVEKGYSIMIRPLNDEKLKGEIIIIKELNFGF